jgi:hypothetical protein
MATQFRHLASSAAALVTVRILFAVEEVSLAASGAVLDELGGKS